jgi:hypothetical protein
MTETNAIAGPQKRFSLAEMSAVMMDRKRVPYGFFLSQALWDNISARFKVEIGTGIGTAPFDLHGIMTALDPSLPDTEFDVAFTEQAWRERLSQLTSNQSKCT